MRGKDLEWPVPHPSRKICSDLTPRGKRILATDRFCGQRCPKRCPNRKDLCLLLLSPPLACPFSALQFLFLLFSLPIGCNTTWEGPLQGLARHVLEEMIPLSEVGCGELQRNALVQPIARTSYVAIHVQRIAYNVLRITTPLYPNERLVVGTHATLPYDRTSIYLSTLPKFGARTTYNAMSAKYSRAVPGAP